MLRYLGARYPRRAAGAWRMIAKILLEEYSGDPRNLTPRPLAVSELARKLRKFPLLRGCKLMPFYLRVMRERGLLKAADPENIEILVNLQITRLRLYTGFVKAPPGAAIIIDEELRRLISSAWRRVARELGVPPWRQDEPAWNAARIYCSKLMHEGCPLSDVCKKRVVKVQYKKARD